MAPKIKNSKLKKITILRMIEQHPGITQKAVEQKIGFNIKKLVEQGLVERKKNIAFLYSCFLTEKAKNFLAETKNIDINFHFEASKKRTAENLEVTGSVVVKKCKRAVVKKNTIQLDILETINQSKISESNITCGKMSQSDVVDQMCFRHEISPKTVENYMRALVEEGYIQRGEEKGVRGYVCSVTTKAQQALKITRVESAKFMPLAKAFDAMEIFILKSIHKEMLLTHKDLELHSNKTMREKIGEYLKNLEKAGYLERKVANRAVYVCYAAKKKIDHEDFINSLKMIILKKINIEIMAIKENIKEVAKDYKIPENIVEKLLEKLITENYVIQEEVMGLTCCKLSKEGQLYLNKYQDNNSKAAIIGEILMLMDEQSGIVQHILQQKIFRGYGVSLDTARAYLCQLEKAGYITRRLEKLDQPWYRLTNTSRKLMEDWLTQEILTSAKFIVSTSAKPVVKQDYPQNSENTNLTLFNFDGNFLQQNQLNELTLPMPSFSACNALKPRVYTEPPQLVPHSIDLTQTSITAMPSQLGESFSQKMINNYGSPLFNNIGIAVLRRKGMGSETETDMQLQQPEEQSELIPECESIFSVCQN